MSLRPPSSYLENASGTSPINVLEYELMAERADSLGRAGQRAEAALLKLKDASAEDREDLLDEAAREVYALFIQREICGLRNGREVIARYGISGAVLARLGVTRKRPRPDS
jgi:hypothetical protein